MGGRVAQAAATVVVGIVVLGMLLVYAALSYVIGAEVPEMAKGFFELTLVVSPIVALPIAALVAATGFGVIRARAKAGWFGYVSLTAGALMALVSSGFTAHGAASPDVEQQVVFGILAIWLITTGPGLARLRTPHQGSVDLPVV
jgi:hypothetical protein